MKALFDTNIIIDALNGHDVALAEIAASTAPAISAITMIEVLTGATDDTESAARTLLMRFKMIDVDSDIADYAVTLRQERRLTLTDAIIVATAQATGLTLVTRDAKLANEFDDPPVLVPYRV